MLDPLELTAALVALDSRNPGPGEKAVADFVTSQVGSISGVALARVEIAPGRPNLLLSVDRGPGANAVLVAADVIRAFDRFTPPVSRPGPIACRPTVNAGVFVTGGVGFGTWPGRCVIGCEIRLVPGMDRAEVTDAIARLVEGAVAGRAGVEIRYLADGRGWSPATPSTPMSRWRARPSAPARPSSTADQPA